MKTLISQAIDNTFYSYNPREFMPIWYGDKLLNRRAFVLYKARKALHSVVR